MSPRHLTDDEFVRYSRAGEPFSRDDYLERIESLMERLLELERTAPRLQEIGPHQGMLG